MSKRSREESTAERSEKRQKKEKSLSNGKLSAENKSSAEKPRLSKEERREQKKLKKAKQESETVENTAPAENGEEVDSGSKELLGGVDEQDEKARRKAARKAEKARLKAESKGTSGSAQGEQSDKKGTAIRPQPATAVKVSALHSPAPAPLDSPEVETDYEQSAALSAVPQSEIDAFLAEKYVTIVDPKKSQLRPITAFSHLPASENIELLHNFSAPTPIQAAAWPHLFARRDVVGVAETGSGKTLAFGLPCIRALRLMGKDKRRRGIQAVMVSPTRELAMQIFEQMVKIAGDLKVVCLYGGIPKEQQRADLKKSSIIVATPGRLKDLMDEGAADLSTAKYVVLDEADRMLDKGFEEDIKYILNATPPTPERQTLMFTATWPQSIRELAATYMTAPVRINIGENTTGDLRANTRIKQLVEVVDPRGKEQRLIQLLKQHQSGKQKDDRILVFCLYKKEATRIENFIRMKGYRVAGIHGDLSQQQRNSSLESFKSGKVPILVATDVAARGLDIPAVKVVINVTFPLTVEDYVHRIGRYVAQ